MMALSKFIRTGFQFLNIALFLANFIYGKESGIPHDKRLPGAGGVVQSNRVAIQHSNIDGPMHMKLFNDYVKDKGAITPDSSLSPTGLPTFVLTEAPTEIPTESPTDFYTEAPTAPPPSGNAFCGCSDIPTEVVERVSPTTGRIWMDRNLGASRNATNVDDPFAYGCSFQWGRGRDGSASMVWSSKTSGTGVTGTAPGPVNQPFPACNDTEKFLTVPIHPHDWLKPKNDTLWQTGSPLDPCPAGYQVPSLEEWGLEAAGIAGKDEAYEKIGLTTAGFRDYVPGDVFNTGISYYWSRTADGDLAKYFFANLAFSGVFGNFRADGFSVRCIKMQ